MPRNAKREREIVPPDGGYVDGCMYSFSIVLTEIKNHYGITQEVANLVPSLNTGFLFCSGPIVSGLSNQFGIRPVVMIGAFITSLVYISSTFCPTIFPMLIIYGVVGGLSTGCTYIASLISVAQYFDKLKGITTGITMSGSGFGSFAFAPISQLLIKKYDWKITMIILAVVIMQCCIMGALLRPVPTRLKPVELSNTRPFKPNKNKRNELEISTFTGSVMSISSENQEKLTWYTKCGKITLNIVKEIFDLKLLFQNFGFLLIVLSNFFVFLGYFMPFIYIPVRAGELKIENYGWILSTIGIVNIPSRLIFGFLADKRFLTPVNLNNISLILVCVPLWLFGYFTTFWTQIGFAVVFAFGMGGMNCLCTPYLNDIVGPEKFSNATGIVNLFRGIACFAGPFIGGKISNALNSTLSGFYFSAICITVGLVFSVMITFLQKCCPKKENNFNRAEMQQIPKA